MKYLVTTLSKIISYEVTIKVISDEHCSTTCQYYDGDACSFKSSPQCKLPTQPNDMTKFITFDYNKEILESKPHRTKTCLSMFKEEYK